MLRLLNRVCASEFDAIRKFTERRPAVIIAAGALLGCIFEKYVPIPLWLIAAAVFVLLCIFSFHFIKTKRTNILSVTFLVFSVFALLFSFRSVMPEDLPEGTYVLTATVSTQPAEQTEKHRTVITLENEKGKGLEYTGKIRLYLYDCDEEIQTGDILHFDKIKLSIPDGITNPGGFDFRSYLWIQNVPLCASAQGKDMQITGHESSLKRSLFIFRNRLCDLSDSIFADQSDVIRSMLLGDRTILSEETYEDFATVGIAHLIAISGLHVSAIALALEWLLKKLRLPRIPRVIIVTMILILYSIMTGSSVSTKRAVIMYLIASVTALCGYGSDLLNTLCLSLLIQLTCNPLYIGDNSFLLSYASVFAIACTADLIQKNFSKDDRKGLRFLLTTVVQAGLISVFVELITYPLLCRLFYSVPLLSSPVNMLCVPFAMLALYGAIVVLCIGAVWTKAAFYLAAPIRFIWHGIKAVSGFVAELPIATLNTGSWVVIAILAYGTLTLFSSPYFTRSHQRRAVVLSLMFCIIATVTLWPKKPLDHMRIRFLDVGYGDGAVFETNGYFYCVDTGRDTDIVCDYLTQNKAALRGIFVTHPDSDHAGGLKELLRRYPKAEVYLPDCWMDMDVPEDMKDDLTGKSVRYLSAGDVLDLPGDMTVNVLWPPQGFIPEEDNNGCLVVEALYADVSTLFMADLTDDYDKHITANCDVMKVAHHGSKYATTADMLSNTAPEIAVISVSSNSFGHPTDEVLTRLRDTGSAVYRTDTGGTITIDIQNDGTISVSAFLDGE